MTVISIKITYATVGRHVPLLNSICRCGSARWVYLSWMVFWSGTLCEEGMRLWPLAILGDREDKIDLGGIRCNVVDIGREKQG